MKKIILLLAVLAPLLLFSQEEDKKDETQRLPDGVKRSVHQHYLPEGKKVTTPRVQPLHWWVGMKNPQLEILIYDNKIAYYQVEINYEGVKVLQTTSLENPNYLFVKINVDATAKAGTFDIILKDKKGKKVKKYPYELKNRNKDKERIAKVSSKDFIYLIMPDRFSNGDPSNDSFGDMQQTGINRKKMFFRHGGDIQGIINHLDYLQELGVTSLWINPVQENDQPYESYHGYAITEHYTIDKRFGDNALYKTLVDECQKRNMTVVMDVIYNHVGDKHWFIQDIPSRDWIHQFDEMTKTTYRAPVHMDPYASTHDKEKMTDGWFDNHMPDLNQKNPQLATYLIQNAIWWIEYSGIDAYRIDTYAYPDQDFMADWAKAIKKEYPHFFMFAETWVHGAAVQAQFTEGNFLRGDYNSEMPAVTDFQLYYAINEALTQEQGWTSGAAKIYYTLAKDFLYQDPYKNVVFLDNHDLSRYYSMVGEDFKKYKAGITFLLTTRGTPMMYYGTEILMKNFSDPDGRVREDFPGGWEGDKFNKFTKAGRNELENEAFNFVKKLANYRKENPVLQTGKLMQFVPENGVYVYFRYNDQKTIMVILNTHGKNTELDLAKYKERIAKFTQAKSITDNTTYNLKNEKIGLKGFQSLVLELN